MALLGLLGSYIKMCMREILLRRIFRGDKCLKTSNAWKREKKWAKIKDMGNNAKRGGEGIFFIEIRSNISRICLEGHIC